MMVLGLLMGMVGIFTAGISAFFYTSGHEPAGITGMAMGTGFFVMGVMIFLTYFVLRLAGRGFDFLLRGRIYSIDVIIKGSVGTSPQEDGAVREDGDTPRGRRIDRYQ
jgi:hypothetical protein